MKEYELNKGEIELLIELKRKIIKGKFDSEDILEWIKIKEEQG